MRLAGPCSSHPKVCDKTRASSFRCSVPPSLRTKTSTQIKPRVNQCPSRLKSCNPAALAKLFNNRRDIPS